MKKSSIWKLLFSALTVFAVAVFAGCTDDNDDMGAPYLNVTPENLTFDAEGQPADEYNGTFIVETNRPWRATSRMNRLGCAFRLPKARAMLP